MAGRPWSYKWKTPDWLTGWREYRVEPTRAEKRALQVMGDTPLPAGVVAKRLWPIVGGSDARVKQAARMLEMLRRSGYVTSAFDPLHGPRYTLTEQGQAERDRGAE